MKVTHDLEFAGACIQENVKIDAQRLAHWLLWVVWVDQKKKGA